MKKSKIFILISIIFLTVFGLGLIEKIDAATILSENFDSTCYDPYYSNHCSIPPPDGWATDDGVWVLGRICASAYRGSGGYAGAAFLNNTYSLPSLMATKGLSMSTSGNYTLTFWVRNAGSCVGGGNYTGLNVYRNTSQTTRGTQIGSTLTITSTTFSQQTINFTVPSNATYYIQFDELYGSNDYIIIDDVIINETIVNSAPTISSVPDTPDPVTAGGAISFPVNWSDPNAGDVTKIHICTTNAITASTQTCTVGSWCNTYSWSATSPTSCSYTTSDTGTKSYYAFVCDDDNACSSGFAGTFVVESAISVPTVLTKNATIDEANLKNNQVILIGNVSITGGENPSQRILEWGLSPDNYTYNYDAGSGGTGDFTHTISLTSGSIYYYRARAYNSEGWGYGTEKRVAIYLDSDGPANFPTDIENIAPSCSYMEATLDPQDMYLGVTFSGGGNDPDGSIVECEWDFGDGYTATVDADNGVCTSVYYEYYYGSEPITYCAKLRVKDNLGEWSINTGCPGDCSKGIPVDNSNLPPEVVNPIITNEQYCTSFMGQMRINFSWTYSDPNGDSGSRFEFIMNDADDYNNPKIIFAYDVTIPNGTQQTKQVIVSTNPQADELSYNQSSYYWWVKVFDDSGEPSEWTPGQGSPFSTPAHPYPYPDFIPSSLHPSKDAEVVFTDNSRCYTDSLQDYLCRDINTNNNEYNPYIWNFGNGTTCKSSSSPDSPCRRDATTTYSTIGVKVVRLEITDDIGTCTSTEEINVSLPLPQWKEIKPF